MDEIDATMIAETENFMVWFSKGEGEKLYHLELGGATLHLMSDEWDEFLTLMKVVLE